MPQNFYELLWIFVIYAFFGWCTEVAYAGVNHGKFVNRGFLNGPYCPIYGCGVVLVVVVLTPLKENLLILFIGSFLLTSIIEFFTGFILEKVFHNKWWDYSKVPFNIKGYVCLKFSIYWGLACTFVMKIIHPIIYKFITVLPKILGIVLIFIFFSGFLVDIIITVASILKLNKHLKLMDEIALQIHKVSDEIGENIYGGVVVAEELIKQKDELTEKYKEILEKKTIGAKRLVKAFPEMTHTRQNEALQKYKEFIIKKAQEKKNG